MGSFCFFLLLLSSSADSAPAPTGKQYVILIDAGSSGSRMHVHGYTRNTSVKGGMPIVDPSLNVKKKPGLSSYASTPSQAAESIALLRTFAEEQVPAAQRAATPIYLQATAGLRVIPSEKAEAILENVRDELQTWGFRFERSWAKIISGREEGINGFIASNYLLGVLNKPDVDEKQTYGVLEMGGASLQLTFCPDVNQMTKEQQQDLVSVTLGGNTFQVYTYSYLGYGLEKAAERYQSEQINNIEADGNPCALTHSMHSGAGDFDKCKAGIDTSLFFDGAKHQTCDSCSFMGLYQPSLQGERFLAIENFWYTTEFFGLEKEHPFLEKLQEKGKKYCSTDFKEVSEEPPDANKYCFSSAYITSLLTQGLSFDSTALSGVQLAHDIEGSGIDWALGAVIVAITSPASAAFNWTAPVLLAGLMVLVLGGYCYSVRKRRAHSFRGFSRV